MNLKNVFYGLEEMENIKRSPLGFALHFMQGRARFMLEEEKQLSYDLYRQILVVNMEKETPPEGHFLIKKVSWPYLYLMPKDIIEKAIESHLEKEEYKKWMKQVIRKMIPEIGYTISPKSISFDEETGESYTDSILAEEFDDVFDCVYHENIVKWAIQDFAFLKYASAKGRKKFYERNGVTITDNYIVVNGYFYNYSESTILIVESDLPIKTEEQIDKKVGGWASVKSLQKVYSVRPGSFAVYFHRSEHGSGTSVNIVAVDKEVYDLLQKENL